MGVLIIVRGIPGAGKTVWAKGWVADDPVNRRRINRDDIRMMLFGVAHGCDEGAVTKAQTALLRAFMYAGNDIVLDNTNLNPGHLRRVVELATRSGYRVEYRDMEVPVEVAVARDARRDRSVGADVVRSFADRFTDGGRLRAVS